MGPQEADAVSPKPKEHAPPPPGRLDAVANWSDPHRKRRKFILCFDGTGNKFSGTDSDSNILKIYRMLDRNDDSQFHYYQPGIGTYVTSTSLSHTSMLDKINSQYQKSKDSAVGTSFDHHVMGGYKFLMRYYVPGDDIYLFGFSRGAYTARFLAEMLDHVGLLSAGNEEMCRFAWKTFQKWQMRQERNEKEKAEKKQHLDYMMAFRETFSRPVRRIRFMGLFDTVNSVPRFESAWMQRSKFPYTARSTAKVIRHAVAIDERRAKFRQDLISEIKPDKTHHYQRKKHHKIQLTNKAAESGGDPDRGRKRSSSARYNPSGRRQTLNVPEVYRDRSETAGIRNLSPGFSARSEDRPTSTRVSSTSNISIVPMDHYEDDSDDEGEQDIREVWFAGCHADIGGGWPLHPDEDSALSHIPLVWMVREAQRAGLNFDEEKLRSLKCCDDSNPEAPQPPNDLSIPRIAIDPGSPDPTRQQCHSTFNIPLSPHNTKDKETSTPTPSSSATNPPLTHFHNSLYNAATKGKIHDVLQFHNGANKLSVISWNIMEYLPFRRMDLQSDGSWKSITWPLPKGEVRDIPENAMIHVSVIRRMEARRDYRPGNLIVGGGGRGVRTAPGEMGIGTWVSVAGVGDPVEEVVVRAERPERVRTGGSVVEMGMTVGGP